jgi:hypothetical protein
MNPKKITVGTILLVTFFIVLFLIFMPIFGSGKNGLEYSDDFFNSLAKGSSNYMENMRKLARPYEAEQITVSLNLKEAADKQKLSVEAASKLWEPLLQAAGGQVQSEGGILKVTGTLGKIMMAAIDDSDAMFNNQGDKVKAKYQYDPKVVLKNWWFIFKDMDKDLKNQKKFKAAKDTGEIMKRSIEPGYNFYGISPEPVSQNVFLLTFMLVFYVVYTLWYGFGVFELFEGLGMGAHGGHKEEV